MLDETAFDATEENIEKREKERRAEQAKNVIEFKLKKTASLAREE